jgi:flavin reductase (DIM6/NTAB) family NADH-FMN oxidoreductase RutF
METRAGDEARLLDHRAFRRFVNTVAVVGVAVGDAVNAMAAEWCTPVSIEPRLLGVYIGDTRYTGELMDQATVFGISLLSDRQAHLAHLLGSWSGRERNKAAEIGNQLEWGAVERVPLVRDAQAQYECRIHSRTGLGDHILVVGAPVAARINGQAAPLLYHGGTYHRLGPLIPKTDR